MVTPFYRYYKCPNCGAWWGEIMQKCGYPTIGCKRCGKHFNPKKTEMKYAYEFEEE